MTINIKPHLIDADRFTRTLQLILHDDTGNGIFEVRIVEAADPDVTIETRDFSEECPSVVELTVEVPKGRVPIEVIAYDCTEEQEEKGRRFEEVVDVAPPGSETDLDPLELPCTPEFCPENVDCSDEQAAVEEVRDEILKLCDKAQRLRNRRDKFASAAATTFELARGFVATATSLSGTWFGSILAAVFFALAAAAFIVAATLAAIAAAAQRRLNAVEDQIEDARDRFSEAAATARKECCTQCIFIDLSQPEC